MEQVSERTRERGSPSRGVAREMPADRIARSRARAAQTPWSRTDLILSSVRHALPTVKAIPQHRPEQQSPDVSTAVGTGAIVEDRARGKQVHRWTARRDSGVSVAGPDVRGDAFQDEARFFLVVLMQATQ